MSGKIWAEADLEYLENNYLVLGQQHCADKLQRSTASIRQKASRLGLVRQNKGRPSKTHKEYEGDLLYKEAKAYPLETYSGSDVPILHACENGHEWKIKPSHVLSGVGCPVCATSGFNPRKPAILYYIKIEFENLRYYKLGITAWSVWDRFELDRDKKITILKETYFELGANAQEVELDLLKKYPRVKVENFLKSGGNTELFEFDILGEDLC